MIDATKLIIHLDPINPEEVCRLILTWDDFAVIRDEMEQLSNPEFKLGVRQYRLQTIDYCGAYSRSNETCPLRAIYDSCCQPHVTYDGTKISVFGWRDNDDRILITTILNLLRERARDVAAIWFENRSK